MMSASVSTGESVRDDGAVLGPWQLRFLLLAFIWGSSFLSIKLALDTLGPTQIAFGRILLGLGFLAVVLVVRGDRLPTRPILWLHLAVAGFFLNALPFALFSWSETHITSSLAGIYNATAPLFTMIVAALILHDEQPTRRRVVGLLAGLSGVFVVLGVWETGPGSSSIPGQLAALGATASYGVAYPYARRFLAGRGLTVPVLATGQLVCAAIWLSFTVPWSMPTFSRRSLLGLVLLGLAGTGVAYLLSYSLITERGATTTSSVNYLIPVISVSLGVVLLGESLTWNQPVGACLVIAGVVVAERASQRE
jgi:drug/metabolite transporter (DMT)-like permease